MNEEQIKNREKWQMENQVNELARCITDTYIQFGKIPESMLEEYKMYKSELIDIQIKELEDIIEEAEQIE